MRRSFLSYAVGMLAAVGVTSAQEETGHEKAILQKDGRAVVCPDDSILCPVCKTKTCSTINATMVIGNENRSYPESSVLFEFHIVRCSICHVLFTRE